MSKQTVIVSLADLSWLRETHVKSLPYATRFVIMFGNEDAPTKVHAWASPSPHHAAPPDFIWLADD